MKQMLFFCSLILSSPSFSQPKILADWKMNVKVSLNSINKSKSLTIDSDGNCYVLGTTWLPDSSKDILLVKYKADGTEIWKRTYDNPSHGDDIPMAMTLDKFGNIWACGMAKTRKDNADFLIVKFNPDGIPVSSKLYDGRDQAFDCAITVVADKQGYIYSAGYETSLDSGINLMLVRYRPDGSLLWKRGYSTRQMDVANQLIVDDSSNVYMCGTINNGPHSADILIQKYDPDGNKKWQLIYDGPQGQNDAGQYMSADDSMNIYVTGFTNHTNNRADIPLLKLTRNGKLIQEKFYSGRIADCGAVNLAANDTVINVIGSCNDYNIGVLSSMLVQYDKAGNEKKTIKAPDDVQFLDFEEGLSTPLIFGSKLTHPDNTLQPFIAGLDSLNEIEWTFSDSTVFGLAHIMYVHVKGNSIYFLGDDTGDATGTIYIFKYKLDQVAVQEVKKKKPPVKSTKSNKKKR